MRSVREALRDEQNALKSLRVRRGKYRDYPRLADIGEVPLTYLIFRHLLKRKELRDLCIHHQDYYPRTDEGRTRRKYADIVIALTPDETKWAYIECKKFGSTCARDRVAKDRNKLVDVIRVEENEDRVGISGYLLILSEARDVRSLACQVEGLRCVGGGIARREGLSFGLFQIK